jgi:molybdopterin-guanine dinucleotide biosynthesis protein A
MRAVDLMRKKRDSGEHTRVEIGVRTVAGRCPAVFVSGTDLPFLHPDLVLALAARRGEHDAAVPVTTPM